MTWLPTNYSEHGGAVDALLLKILLACGVVFVVTWGWLLLALLTRRKDRAHYSRGSGRMEIGWLVVTATILIALFWMSRQVWAGIKSPAAMPSVEPFRALVVGEQFKWNVVYPGPDNKLGRYLVFPKPTDPLWPNPGIVDEATLKSPPPYEFQGVKGPASLPPDQASQAIAAYIDQVNRLGKDFTDPAGWDDDWQAALARTLTLPVNRPTEITVTGKDVIHSFFLPHFRVKMDTVPGLLGTVRFTPTTTSKQLEQQTQRTLTLDQLRPLIAKPQDEWLVRIDEKSPGAAYDDGRSKGWLYRDAAGKTIVRDGRRLTPEIVDKLAAAGVTQVTAYQPGSWPILCAELCGQGHYTMVGRLVVVP
jgi:cytochrome c oxidase subunit 2